MALTIAADSIRNRSFMNVSERQAAGGTWGRRTGPAMR
jgi:hypothetical protein